MEFKTLPKRILTNKSSFKLIVSEGYYNGVTSYEYLEERPRNSTNTYQSIPFIRTKTNGYKILIIIGNDKQEAEAKMLEILNEAKELSYFNKYSEEFNMEDLRYEF